jgi:hypothetical protein
MLNNIEIPIDIDFLFFIKLISLNFIFNLKLQYRNIYNKINLFINEFIFTLKSSDGLRVCFISIYVATLLTIYEIILFYSFVIPEINNEINNGIITMAYETKKQINLDINIKLQPDTLLIDLFKYLNITIIYDITNEKIYQNTNELLYSNIITFFIQDKFNLLLKYIIQNETTKILILSILKTLYQREKILVDEINNYTVITVIFLLGFLMFCLLFIKKILNERKEILGNYVWISSWFTIVMILMFQYSFFIYANKYKYMGSTNTDELVYFILNQL